jgi:late competence protein required for DNA uptake (superfamily II DNA/RNA helicase)
MRLLTFNGIPLLIKYRSKICIASNRVFARLAENTRLQMVFNNCLSGESLLVTVSLKKVRSVAVF